MITSRRNETLKAIRRLRRRQGEEAILEGPHLVLEALELGLPLSSVLVTPGLAARDEGRRILERLPRPPLEVEASVLAELADADSPRGVLAVATLPRARGAAELPIGEGTYLLLDRVQEPGNLGAIARVAEAFDARALALTAGCVHPNHPRALRASAGSLLRLPVVREVDPVELRQRFAPPRARWIGLVAHGGGPLGSGIRAGVRLLCCGSEGAGLSDEVEARLDGRWTISLSGRAESLNVAVAVGIALHSLRPTPSG